LTDFRRILKMERLRKNCHSFSIGST